LRGEEAMAAMVVASSTAMGMSAVGRRDVGLCSSSSTARLPHQVLVTSRKNLVREFSLALGEFLNLICSVGCVFVMRSRNLLLIGLNGIRLPPPKSGT